MPSLFEEMQEARRRGELALPEEEPPEPDLPEVTFTPSALPGHYLCEVCWGLVDGRTTPAHGEWHRRTGV